jgi:hypothetical protein
VDEIPCIIKLYGIWRQRKDGLANGWFGYQLDDRELLERLVSALNEGNQGWIYEVRELFHHLAWS